MNRVSDMPLPENFKVNILTIIVVLLVFIFGTGRAAPSQLAPEVIIAPS